MTFALQSGSGSAEAPGGGLAAGRCTLTTFVVMLWRGAGPGRGASFARRRQFHAGPPRLGQADGDGLLRRTCAVFALPDVVHFLPDEFTSLRGGGFAFPLVLVGALQCAVRHRPAWE